LFVVSHGTDAKFLSNMRDISTKRQIEFTQLGLFRAYVSTRIADSRMGLTLTRHAFPRCYKRAVEPCLLRALSREALSSKQSAHKRQMNRMRFLCSGEVTMTETHQEPRPRTESGRPKIARSAQKLRPTQSALPAKACEALAGLIHTRILPELSASRHAVPSATPHLITAQDIENLRFCIGAADPQPTELLLRNLKRRGVSRQTVLLDLFTPVARLMGDEWLADDCSFAEVTLAVARLARLMRTEAMPPLSIRLQDEPRSILLTTCYGDDHGFGLLVLEDHFKADGWTTKVSFAPRIEETLSTLAQSHLDVVALSVACTDSYTAIASQVRRMRQASRNSDLIVMVGGAAFIDKPSHALALGADGAASDAADSVATATALLRTHNTAS
jgi:MerR family transcriptional regulator, light-induced transcriptional regulator